MNHTNLLFIGFDTGKEHAEVAYSSTSWEDKPTLSSRIKTTKQAIQKLARQFQAKYPGATLHFVYQAGPCGYWIYRILTKIGQSKMGHPCYGVAPSRQTITVVAFAHHSRKPGYWHDRPTP